MSNLKKMKIINNNKFNKTHKFFKSYNINNNFQIIKEIFKKMKLKIKIIFNLYIYKILKVNQMNNSRNIFNIQS